MTEELRCALEEMLNDLEAHKLEVQLAPLNPRLRGWSEGGMKRVVVDAPPRWYRKMCGENLSQRAVRRGKPDTVLKRKNILRSLRRLLANEDAGIYGPQILKAAKKLAATATANPF